MFQFVRMGTLSICTNNFYMKLLRVSKSGTFDGVYFDLVLKNFQTNKGQITVGKIDNQSIMTDREPYYLQVIYAEDDDCD